MTTNNGGAADYEIRAVPFDEWTDFDTLVHRTAITSGDFDYVLSPLCPDCGTLLMLSYADTETGESVLEALTCDDCALIWRTAAESPGSATD